MNFKRLGSTTDRLAFFRFLPTSLPTFGFTLLQSSIFFTSCTQQLSHYSTSPELSGNEPIPVKLYANADIQKESILRENKGLSGVYR